MKKNFKNVITLFTPLFLIMACMVSSSSCAGYKLGSCLPPEIKSIYIKPFINRCKEPFADIEARAATITRFQEDGSLKIVEEENADAILECSVDKIRLKALRYRKDDKTKPNEYRMFVAVSYTLKKPDGKIITEGAVEGETTFIFAGNMAGAKRTALPKACQDMAKRLVEKMAETW